MNENGKIKERPFAQCSRKCFGNSNFCKKHMDKKSKYFNWSELVINKMATEATPKSSFFTKKASKIFDKNTNLPDEINKVMENPDMREKLIMFAKNLLSNSTVKKPSLSITLDAISDEIDDNEKDNDNSSVDEDNEQSEEELVENDSEENVSVDDSSEEIEVIDDSDNDSEGSEEEIECEQIYTKDNRLLYLDPTSMTVYDPESDNTGKEFAKLTEVEYKSAPIEYNEKTWICGINYSYKDINYIRCKLTDKVFSLDEPHTLLGKAIKDKKTGKLKFRKVKTKK